MPGQNKVGDLARLAIDHVFILVEPGAKVADRLRPLGFEEGPGRVHVGQGTANRRFLFSNGMLEFLWVRDAGEASAGQARGMRFPERTTVTGASPFGVILRRRDSRFEGRPFSGWTYQPAYFKPPMAFLVGENASHVREPLCIYAPFIEPSTKKGDPGRGQSIHSITIHCPVNEPSRVLAALGDVQGLAMVYGRPHLMEITLGEKCGGGSNDFRPDIPLIIHS